MGDSAIHFSDPSAAEQEPNGVQTGFVDPQLFEFLGKVAAEWKEGDRLDVLLLRAICVLSCADLQQCRQGFSSQEIVEAVVQLRGRPWSSTDDKNQMSDDVRRSWNRLLETWAGKEEGVVQRLTDEGISWTPSLRKTEGGGAGRTSRYRIEWNPCVATQGERQSVAERPVPEDRTTTVRYVSEDIEDASAFARIFARGYHLTGWRRWIYIAVLGGPLLLCWLLLVDMMFGVTVTAAVGGKTPLTAVMSVAVAFVATWFCVGPLLLLGERNIVVAPWWMQSVDDDRLLERRYPPRYAQKTIKAVRYTSLCPLCGGKVSVKSGGVEFWGRLIGRCEHAPAEHVFSFDHVTRNGRWLR